MPHATFHLNIEANEIKKYYQGRAHSIFVEASNGLKIQFPANLILPYVTREGVKGNFILEYQISGKAKSLRRL